MSRPQITIDNITFFLIRVVDNMHKRQKSILKKKENLWVYRSNSEFVTTRRLKRLTKSKIYKKIFNYL